MMENTIPLTWHEPYGMNYGLPERPRYPAPFHKYEGNENIHG
jgi:hypothetical protein